VLSVVAGVGLLVATEAVQFDPAAFPTHRTFGGGLVGYGLPVSLYGITVAAASGALLAGPDATDDPGEGAVPTDDSDDEAGFIRGDRPEE